MVQDKLTANNSAISSIVNTIVVEKGGGTCINPSKSGFKIFSGAATSPGKKFTYTLTQDSSIQVNFIGGNGTAPNTISVADQIISYSLTEFDSGLTTFSDRMNVKAGYTISFYINTDTRYYISISPIS